MFVNNILQLGYFYDLDFQTSLGTTSFFLGFTASNSEAGSRINLLDWDLKLVTANIGYSSNALVLSKKRDNVFQINEVFSVNILLRNGCNAKYYPNSVVDDPRNFTLDNRFAGSCNLLDRNMLSTSDASFQLTFSCSKPGTQKLVIYYLGQIVGKPVSVVIQSSTMDRAKIDFFQGTVGNIDAPFKFRFIPYDSNGNIPDITVDTVRTNLNVQWPNPVDSNKDFLINKDADNTFVISLSTNKTGNYKVTNLPLFVRFIANGEYSFTIEAGAVDYSNSYARLIDPLRFEVVKGSVTVGTKLLLNVYFKDRAGNSIPTSKIPDDFVNTILNTNGQQNILTNPQKNFVFLAYNIVLYTAGQASIVVNYLNKPISCQYCALTVNAGASLFDRARLFPWNNITNTFEQRDQPEYTVNKGDNFQFLLVLKDQYNNTVPVNLPSDYVASISGNNMNVLQLKLTLFGQGLKLEVQDADQAYYKNLVGLQNYSINATEVATQKLRTWRLNIVSDNTDNGGGNGDYVPANTIWFWLNPLMQNQYAVAGETYRVAVQLMTNQSLRYNGYIDEKLIVCNFQTLLGTLGEVLSAPRKTAITGTYTFTFSLRQGKFIDRTIGFTIAGVTLSKTKTFKDYPADPVKALVSSQSLMGGNGLQLNNGEVGKAYSFVYLVFDRFGNPNSLPDQSLSLALKNVDKSLTLSPNCQKNSVGVYSCLITASVFGNYSLDSSFLNNSNVGTYWVYFARPRNPALMKMIAGVINDPTKVIHAGDQINFMIKVKDESNVALNRTELLNFFSHFSLTVQQPDTSSLTSVPLLTITDNGEIVTTYIVNKAGKHQFFPKYEVVNINCPVCSVDVKANEVNTAKILIFAYDASTEIPVQNDTALLLDNSKKDPIYILRFRDSFNNVLNTPADGVFSAKLTVPGGAKSVYVFEVANWGPDAVKLRIQDIDYSLYKSELHNPNATLTFISSSKTMASLNATFKFNTILKGLGGDDDDYSNDDPDPEHSIVSPLELTITAGDWTDIRVELRTKNDKLFNHPLTFGWYADKGNSLKMMTADGLALVPGITLGKQKGTYNLHFTCYRAYITGVYVNVSYLSPADNTTWVLMSKKFKLTVYPAAVKYLIMDETTIKNAVVGQKVINSMKPYDLYGNLIPKVAVNALNLQMSSSNPNETAIIPELNQNAAGEVLSGYTLTRPGVITIKALKFRTAALTTIPSYTFNVTAGPVDFQSSMAFLDRNTISAGEKVNWIVYPRDSFSNPLPCNAKDMAILSASKTSPDSQNALAITDSLNISPNNDYYYWAVKLTMAGTHEFKAFYKGDLIRSTNNKVTVNAGSPDFPSTNLALFNLKTSAYDDYDGSKFYQNVANVPEYKVRVYDQFKNQLPALPSDWILSLYLTNNELGTQNGIFFCLDTLLRTFKMCPDNKLQPDLVNPLNRWNDLVTPKDFVLQLRNKNPSSLQNYSMSLSGSNDSDNSNLPVDVQNTILTPMRIDTTVNKTFEFQITIMTTDPTKRRNEWYAQPMSMIKLSFSKNPISYTINYGAKKGMYKVSLISTTSYELDPNVISVSITSILVKNKSVQAYVTPGLPYQFFPYDIPSKKLLDSVQNGSVDATYSQAFIAKDFWGNLINLNTDTPGVNSQVFDSQNGLINHNKVFPLDNEAVIISFAAKISGSFLIYFSDNSQFRPWIAQGQISIPKSLGNVNPGSIRAGETVTVTMTLSDQLGNPLTLSPSFLSSYTIQYFFSLPNDNIYNQGTSPLNIINNQVSFQQKLTVKGVHKFKVSINSQPVDMSNSRVSVSPSDPSLQNSILLYMDDVTNRYLLADNTVPIKENNAKYDPFYSLVLADKYGNEINEFPQELVGQFEVILFGNDYAIDHPIKFLANTVQGNSLAITLNPVDTDRYRAGIYEKTPYNFSITLTTTRASLYYLVSLLGAGDDDNNADVEIPIDPTQTYFDKTALKIVAGASDVFMIEVRTAAGKRKADVPLNLPIKLFFKDDANSNNYTYQVSPGDLRGRFIIRVSGTRANERTNPAVISVQLNGTLVTNKQVALTITAGALDHISSPSDFSKTVSADDDFKFVMIPYDIYNNVANVKIIDINLFVRFPLSWTGAQEFNGFIDPNNGYANYQVKNRGAGDYTVNSAYLNPSLLYTVVPGLISEKFTKVLVNPIKLRAGDSTFIDVYPADAYNNAISPLGSRQNDCVNKISLKYKQDTTINNGLLAPNTQNNSLFQSLRLTKAGLVTIIVAVETRPIACDSCVVEVSPNVAALANTKFFILKADGTYTETNHPESPLGAKNVNLMARLFDKFSNPLQIIASNELFKMSMRGNNMKPLDLIVVKADNQTNGLLIDVDDSDQDYFSTLVATPNYTLTLFYLQGSDTKDTADLLLDIKGNSDDSGNGDIDITKTVVTPMNITLIAGKQGTVLVEFRTSENKRFAGKVAISNLIAKETDASKGTQKLVMSWNFADKSGRFLLVLKGYEALNGNDYKYLQIALSGQNLKDLVVVDIDPDVPDPSKTEILQQLPFNLRGNQPFNTMIRLYDSYNNIYSKSNWVSFVQGRAVTGRAAFKSTTFDATNNAYIIPVVPLYPPRILEVQLVLLNSVGNEFTILSIPWLSQVVNDLDATKTEIRGNTLSGVALGDDFGFYVLLKDVDGYCYEATRNVNVRLAGPYADNSLTSTVLSDNGVLVSFTKEGNAKNAVTEKTDVQSNGTDCLKYYEVKFYGNQIQQIGYYLIEVYLDDLPDPILRNKNAYMRPGPAFPANSFLTLLSPSGLDQDAQLSVYTPIVLRLQLRDNFKNLLNTCNGTTLDLQLSGLTSPQGFTFTAVAGKGYYDITVIVKNLGTVSGGNVILNGQSVQWRLLDQSNMPASFNYGPDKCSNVVPNIDATTLQANQSLVGYKTFFKVNCLDKYGNVANKGGDSFSAQIISIGSVATANSINVPVTVVDGKDGSYRLEFTPTYSGLYKGLVQFNNLPYGSFFFFQIVAGLCDVSTPYYCINTKKCATSYTACGYPDLTCPTTDKPFKCSVTVNDQASVTCVKTQAECDCLDAENQRKCLSDNKCVDFVQMDSMCGFKGQNLASFSCPVDIPVLCSDGSCRAVQNECPSQPGCPPEYRLCPDLTCADKSLPCPDRGTSCPEDRFYRCDDFTCVSNPEDCPSRVTCPTPGQIVCPDGSCVTSELTCKAPRVCNTGLVLCSDGSCMKSYDDCAKGITCPLGQSLCQGNVCKKSCVLLSATNKKVVRLLRLLDGNDTEKHVGECAANQTKCRGTDICVDQPSLCPSTPLCKSNEVKCSDFHCASSKKGCLIKDCPSGTVKCWDKTCVVDSSKCPTRITCPDQSPVLCSDGDCAESSSQCRDSIQCPAYRPIRCGTGECKKTISECPTQTLCPDSHPVRCSDGSCVKDKSTCESIVKRTQCPNGQVKCGDGSCSVSYSLCPTAISCAFGQIRCWNMACADDLSSCDILPGDTVCDADKVQCPDGSCANNITDCPTGLICPFERSIKCDDGNCRESVDDCLRYTDCPETYRRCPDGTCQKGRCASISVTCAASAPYKCFDNTCRNNPFDCPTMPECPNDTPILCADGVCAASRSECPTADLCPLAEPVRCPDGLCYSSVDKCKALDSCPAYKRMCDAGVCVRTDEPCPESKCPASVPLRCPNGVCTKNLTHCDDQNTGCPFDRPIRCKDGQCLASADSCPRNISCASGNLTLCPDGTCRADSICPLANGCPRSQPLKCFSGSCVDPKKQSCPIARCPKNRPFKCPNGLCMSKWNSCPSIYQLGDQNPCASNPFNRKLVCADGSCVESLDECKPTFECPGPSVRCEDGSCVQKRSLCPLAPNSCPEGLRERCENRACVNNSKTDCVNKDGCPNSKPLKCGHYGLCGLDHEDCEKIAETLKLPNNCTVKNPIKCGDQCVESPKDCKATVRCPGAFECIDGTCQKNVSQCPATCPANQTLCSNKKCANSSQLCELSNGCPANKPRKCADGSCLPAHAHCPIHIICPLFKPYLCADFECVGEPSQCSVIPQCPSSLPVRCPDLSCVSSSDHCNNNTVCPPTNMIKCPTGECVDSVDECKNSQSLTQCTEDKPYLCSNQECAARPSDCVSAGMRTGSSRRILASTLTIDQGCDATNPKLCSDGSCRISYDDCDLIQGCFEIAYPYRCQSGECAANSDDCLQDKSLAVCSNGTRRCEDGICRSQCPNFAGCPVAAPNQCPNGQCTNASSQCLQQNDKPVCLDHSIGDCSRPIRSYEPEKMTLTISRYLSSSVSFISNSQTNTKYASLDILPGAFRSNATSASTYDILQINPVAWSAIQGTVTPYSNQKILEFLYPGASKLAPEQFIRSSVFSLAVQNRSQEDYNEPLNLTISIDTIVMLSTNSYCLGVLVNNSWICEDFSNNTNQLNSKSQLTFNLYRDGTYAVILALRTESFVQGGVKQESYCDWWCANGGAVIGAIVGVLIGGVVFGIFFFAFSKYAASRKAKGGVNEELIGKGEDSNEGKRKIEEAAQNLHQKDKIIEETLREKEMVKEQNEKLMHELENLKKELGRA